MMAGVGPTDMMIKGLVTVLLKLSEFFLVHKVITNLDVYTLFTVFTDILSSCWFTNLSLIILYILYLLYLQIFSVLSGKVLLE